MMSQKMVAGYRVVEQVFLQIRWAQSSVGSDDVNENVALDINNHM